MDIYNIKVNDKQWVRSWFVMEGLIEAIDQDSDEEILRALKNPDLVGNYS